MQLQVYRTDSSSYQKSHFLSQEQKVLEGLSGVKYVKNLQETLKDIPFALITNTHTQLENIPKTILDRTKLLIHPNSGTDNLQTEFIKSCKFPIITGNPIRANAVAEYTMACIFSELTRVPNHLHWSTDRTWKRPLLRDQKVLIIGNGHIGQILEKSLSPLVNSLSIYDPFVQAEHVKKTFSLSMFEGINILIIAADLNETSQNLITKDALNKLATKNIIINPARGGIINEQDLITYLQFNSDSRCFLDVFEKEPFIPGFNAHIRNLNKTSHIAGVFDRLNNDIIAFEYIIIKDYLENIQKNSQSKFYQDYSDCILNGELSQSL